MKVGCIIIVYNLDCRVFILQQQAIKKYCQDENYTVEIIDNSDNDKLSAAIKYHAKDNGVNYTRFHSSTPDPSRSHSFASNLSYKRFMDIYDVVFYLDHDCIPVNLYSVETMLNGKVVGGVLSGSKLNYFWPGCLIISNEKVYKQLVDFAPDNRLGLDTGGGLRRLKEKYGDEGCEYFDEAGCLNLAMQEHKDYYFYMMIYKETFIHFLNSSNWAKAEENETRINSLIDITNALMEKNDNGGE